MTNLKVQTPVPVDLEGDLASLPGDGARMAPHWAAPDRIAPRPVSPALIHGVTVPPASARLLDAMSDYGD
ncbi:hypothetical protein GCM10010313_67170 [Streptomyces violarus]|uniref:Uncharacterized protein n=1 Tax=Streptomyces violarus TaxID=67380 RepID=A0A7W4ZUZ5_9ACTN|nr:MULTISPECIES: hypothetical protein [Streptomyces]MBB3079220.1 hypothetical protein [Streptomyces violarus]WRU01769.1 hypothetical protein VJ737_30660 [Streptomyces sp. CGMCC 4.1772]GHD27262.1 hypothetical protein GCM10010313_67170 [Streptomyces violarus]